LKGQESEEKSYNKFEGFIVFCQFEYYLTTEKFCFYIKINIANDWFNNYNKKER
jgi:hypothetical protein